MKRLLILLLLASPAVAQTHTFCAQDLPCSITGAWTTSNLSNFQFAGYGNNTTLAITFANAGSTGAIIIPPSYIGTDLMPALGNVPAIDFRQNSQGGVAFWHGTRAMFPVASFPGGNDFPINVWGPGDTYLSNNPIACSSSTNVAPGTTTITVGTCADNSGNGGPTGTTAVLSHASGVVLVIDPNTVNEETITNANWSIASGTTITATFANSHTAPYTVWQAGTTFFNTQAMAWRVNNVNAAVFQEAAGVNTLAFLNATNQPLLITWNTDFPRFYGGGSTGGFLFYGSQGGTGTSGLVRFRNNSTDNTQLITMNTANGNISSGPLTSIGPAASLTGTGACLTITTQTGGAWAGSAKCTAATAASTLIITLGTTAPNGWICYVQDETTRANLFQQTSHNATSFTLTITSVTQNDVFVFSAMAF